jgi:hypothetical protein
LGISDKDPEEIALMRVFQEAADAHPSHSVFTLLKGHWIRYA